jgi:hypothetical protein
VVDDRDLSRAQSTDQALGTPVKPNDASDGTRLDWPGAAQGRKTHRHHPGTCPLETHGTTWQCAHIGGDLGHRFTE